MGVFNFTGFETGNFDEVDSVVGNVAISSAVARTGSYSLCVDPAGAASYVAMGGLNSLGQKSSFDTDGAGCGYYRFYFRCDRAPAAVTAAYGEIFSIADTSVVLSDGLGLSLYLDGNPIFLVPAPLVLGRWHRIGVQRTAQYDPGPGEPNRYRQTLALQVDGVVVYSTQWYATNLSESTFQYCLFGSSVANALNNGLYYYDDIAFADDEMPPPGKVALLRAVGTRSSTYVSASTGQLWECVDEVPRNGFADYVSTDDPPPGSAGLLNCSYYPTLSALPAGSGVVTAVKGVAAFRLTSEYNVNGWVVGAALAYNGRTLFSNTLPWYASGNGVGGTVLAAAVYSEDFGTSVSDISVGVVGNGNSDIDALYMMVESGGSDYTYRPLGRVRVSGVSGPVFAGGVFETAGRVGVGGVAPVRRAFDGGSAEGTLSIDGFGGTRIGYRHFPDEGGLLLAGDEGVPSVGLILVAGGRLAVGGLADTPILLDSVGAIGWSGMASLPLLVDATGGFSFGGAADQPVLADGDGLCSLGGTGDVLVQFSFYHDAEGALTGPSAITGDVTPTGQGESSGRLAMSGRAALGTTANYPVAYVSDYSVEVLYLGELIVTAYEHDPVGGLVCTGDADVDVVPYGEGGRLRVLGTADTQMHVQYQPVGGFLVGGQTPYTSDYFASSSGALVLGGGSFAVTSVVLVKEFSWKIRQTQYASKEFTWSTGPRAFSFFRVIGKCKPMNCPPVQTDCSNNVSFTVNIYARNVSEVCQKLRQRNFQFPIRRIEQFSADPSVLNDPTQCNRLVDVTPSFTMMECVGLLVDYNASAGMVMDAVLVPVFAYEGGGRLRAGGVAVSTTEREYEFVGTGRLAASGGSAAEQGVWSYEPTGRVLVGGVARSLPGQYSHSSSGSIGVVGRWRFLSSAYTVEMSGSILMSAGRAAAGDGVLSVSGVADASFGFAPACGGAAAFGGEATVAVSVATGVGRVGFGGTAGIVSSDLGVLSVGPLGADSVTVSTVQQFGYTPAGPLPSITRTIGTTCCPGGLPLVVNLRQPLGTANYFGDFLLRNGIVWSPTVPLTYLVRDKAWTATVSLRGYSPFAPTRERWTVSYSWNCVPDPVGRLSWQFALLVSLQPDAGPRLVTRLAAVFDSSAVCRTNKAFRFSFQVNHRARTATPVALRPVVLVDEIGLFRSSRTTSAISFKLSEVVDDSTLQTVDINPAVTAAEQTAGV